MTEPVRRPLWISDDPTVIHRVVAHLNKEPGIPLCDTCLAKEIGAPIGEVRNAIARLSASGQCEHGLWWCSRCSTKAFVSLVLR